MLPVSEGEPGCVASEGVVAVDAAVAREGPVTKPAESSRSVSGEPVDVGWHAVTPVVRLPEYVPPRRSNTTPRTRPLARVRAARRAIDSELRWRRESTNDGAVAGVASAVVPTGTREVCAVEVNRVAAEALPA